MPERDLTIEMWVRTPAYKETAEAVQRSELFSYATHAVEGSTGGPSCNLLCYLSVTCHTHCLHLLAAEFLLFLRSFAVHALTVPPCLHPCSVCLSNRTSSDAASRALWTASH